MGVHTYRDLRAWQSAREFKRAAYALTSGPLSRDFQLRDQLTGAAASAVSQIVEGFGRFNPADFARFLVMARASLMEAENHLEDAVDRGLISEEQRKDIDPLVRAALRDVTALMEYLRSAKAATNAAKARAARQARRTPNSEPST